jgi:hypothetical protein
MERRRRIHVAGIIALVVGLHLAALWFLLATSRLVRRRADSGSFEIVLIAPAASEPPHTSQRRRAPAARAQNQQPAPSTAPAPASAPAPAEQENNAIHAPIDWADELSRAAKDAARSATQAPKDFGFPHLPSGSANAPQFDWDYAATHRVERTPDGGLVLHLNDRCVLVFTPIPFPFCAIGTKKPDADLFKNMNKPADAQPASVP